MAADKMCDISHVIFDVDGLLLDTERLYTVSMTEVFSRYGKTFNSQIKAKQMGKKALEAAQVAIDEVGLPITAQEFADQATEVTEKLFPQAQLLPGAEKLVRHLKKHGLPIAIATGSTLRHIGLKTTNHREFFTLFDHAVYSGDDPEVVNGKPAPDCFLVCAKRFSGDVDNSKVLVLEDAPNGVLGAQAAGMPVVWVPTEGVDFSSVDHISPTLKLQTLEEFRPEVFGLPAYDD